MLSLPWACDGQHQIQTHLLQTWRIQVSQAARKEAGVRAAPKGRPVPHLPVAPRPLKFPARALGYSATTSSFIRIFPFYTHINDRVDSRWPLLYDFLPNLSAPCHSCMLPVLGKGSLCFQLRSTKLGLLLLVCSCFQITHVHTKMGRTGTRKTTSLSRQLSCSALLLPPRSLGSPRQGKTCRDSQQPHHDH